MDAFVSSAPRIKLNGEESESLDQSVVSLSVNQPIHGMAHAELLLTNWGTAANSTEPGYLFERLALGDELELQLGLGSQERVFLGEVTAIEETFGEGAPQLVLLAEDKLHRLARKRRSAYREETSPDNIANSLISEAGLQADVGLSSTIDSFMQHNQSDLAYLMRLARRFGCFARISEEQVRVRPEEDDTDPQEYDLQQDVVKARLNADLNHQSRKCINRGWNPGADSDVESESRAVSGSGQSAAGILQSLGWEGDDVAPFPFATAQALAEAHAQSQFEDNALRFVTGMLTLAGDPAIKPGRQLRLAGGSERFNGLYRLYDCQHLFNRLSGYETKVQIGRGTIEGA